MAKKKRSKKARRKRSKAKAVSMARAKAPAVQAQPAVQEAPSRPVAKSTRKAQAYMVDFRKEYPYIYSDLERVGIITAIMLVFMFVLSLILK
ncbi:MAG: hypothetical protein DRI61_13800 [Chloroflexi bacterium]|nr:MAG: hypothetical protein DRI61_13800 [Chloroflexota bacterium]